MNSQSMCTAVLLCKLSPCTVTTIILHGVHVMVCTVTTIILHGDR